jgi:hypothetical protein
MGDRSDSVVTSFSPAKARVTAKPFWSCASAAASTVIPRVNRVRSSAACTSSAVRGSGPASGRAKASAVPV